MFIEKKELLNAIKNKYGDLEDTCGCNVFVDVGCYEWLSVADIVELIEDCPTYEECESEEAIDTMSTALDELRKEKEQEAMHYEKRVELLQDALFALTKGVKEPLKDVRVSKIDFVGMHNKAVCDMNGLEDNDIYGYDVTVHWHGFYCNCGDGAVAASNIIPGVEGVLDEDPTEY